ncbi:MAG: hypothetical protein QOH59_1618 [Gemmatimonadales bacterium]|jgi:hypothetical protein|nr:hypothetical protein [Gemmatimonadales bacterium]
MPAFLRMPAVLLALVTLSCSSSGTHQPAPTPDSSDVPHVRIDNRASLDMDVYVVRNDGERIRLGFVSGGEKSMFALPATVTSGATTIRFEARPVRRGGEPVVSEIFGVHTGEEIAWSIPPQ